MDHRSVLDLNNNDVLHLDNQKRKTKKTEKQMTSGRRMRADGPRSTYIYRNGDMN